MAPNDQNLLEVFVEEILKQNGYNITEEVRAQLVPQFVVEAERRVGAALTPHLSDTASEQLTKFLSEENPDAKQLWDFWQKNIPDFENIVKKALSDYAVEVKNALANIKK
ncbi:MAG: DUF5663 domain-containing protein [Candidatus Magasanikbacteria bacterium]